MAQSSDVNAKNLRCGRGRTLTQLSLALFLLALLSTPAVSQGTTGSILGIIYDPSQALLPGVTVTATHQDTALQRQVVADDEGFATSPVQPLNWDRTLIGVAEMLTTASSA